VVKALALRIRVVNPFWNFFSQCVTTGCRKWSNFNSNILKLYVNTEIVCEIVFPGI